MKSIIRFLLDSKGFTATEYAIAGALVGAGIILPFTELGVAIGQVILNIIEAITS